MITIKLKHYNKIERHKDALKALTELNISYKLYNMGLHCIFTHNEKEIHYWPSTGKWRVPETSETWIEETRYLQGLLDFMGIEFIEQETEEDSKASWEAVNIG